MPRILPHRRIFSATTLPAGPPIACYRRYLLAEAYGLPCCGRVASCMDLPQTYTATESRSTPWRRQEGRRRSRGIKFDAYACHHLIPTGALLVSRQRHREPWATGRDSRHGAGRSGQRKRQKETRVRLPRCGSLLESLAAGHAAHACAAAHHCRTTAVLALMVPGSGRQCLAWHTTFLWVPAIQFSAILGGYSMAAAAGLALSCIRRFTSASHLPSSTSAALKPVCTSSCPSTVPAHLLPALHSTSQLGGRKPLQAPHAPYMRARGAPHACPHTLSSCYLFAWLSPPCHLHCHCMPSLLLAAAHMPSFLHARCINLCLSPSASASPFLHLCLTPALCKHAWQGDCAAPAHEQRAEAVDGMAAAAT